MQRPAAQQQLSANGPHVTGLHYACLTPAPRSVEAEAAVGKAAIPTLKVITTPPGRKGTRSASGHAVMAGRRLS